MYRNYEPGTHGELSSAVEWHATPRLVSELFSVELPESRQSWMTGSGRDASVADSTAVASATGSTRPGAVRRQPG